MAEVFEQLLRPAEEGGLLHVRRCVAMRQVVAKTREAAVAISCIFLCRSNRLRHGLPCVLFGICLSFVAAAVTVVFFFAVALVIVVFVGVVLGFFHRLGMFPHRQLRVA